MIMEKSTFTIFLKDCILLVFYLSSQMALTGYIFVIYSHWPKYSFSGTQFILSNVKKRYQCKRGLHRGHHQIRGERRLFLLLLDNLAVILGFLALKDKYNICTLSENKKFICTCCTTGQKNLPKAWFFTCF